MHAGRLRAARALGGGANVAAWGARAGAAKRRREGTHTPLHYQFIPARGACIKPPGVPDNRRRKPNGRRRMHSVMIAGGGPTGMMLAGGRALGGVDAALVEGGADRDLLGSRAGGL